MYPYGDMVSPESDRMPCWLLVSHVAATRHSLASKMRQARHAEPDQRRPDPVVPEVPLTSPSEWAAKLTPRQDRLPGINRRQVMVLRPGANDVRELSPSVDLVGKQDPSGGCGGPCHTLQGVGDSSVRKVIVTR